MKSMIMRLTAVVLFLNLLVANVFARDLIPVGKVVGLELKDRQVVVVGFDGDSGTECLTAGIRSGDIIQKIDDTAITCPEDIRSALAKSDGTVSIQISRNGEISQLRVSPRITKEGPKLGLYLRHGVTGIGTVTWYDPETKKFGTLGHGVHDADGHLLNMTAGTAYHAQVIAVRKGLSGEPGLLKGNADIQDICGSLFKNTSQGVFGTAANRWMGQAVPVAKFEDIRTGDATIRSTVGGTDVQEYSVEILKIYPQERKDSRNFLIKITDPELLGKTGGIVQGMSGSPIIQNGKLVGAVTHVLVNDPTRGYGIFIENMLDAAG